MFLELCLAVVIIPLAFLFPRLGASFFSATERSLSHFASRRWVAILTTFLLAVSLRLAVLPVEPIPVPVVHDDFSYQLMADTFAHGRLTNPTPALWQHFETFHENVRPTYCSKFFPAQGAFLAIGKILFGHPFWGVVFSLGLMSAAMCWAMQGWMPPRWAFLGALLFTMRLGVFGYWANSYWGGSVAAVGGALVIGALPRIKRKQHVGHAVTMGIGLAILANTRPYEGLVFSLGVFAVLAVFLVRRMEWARAVSRVILPIGAVMVCTIAFMCYYFWRTTGDPLRPPYAAYSATYDSAPFVPWRAIGQAPHYGNAVMKNFYLGNIRDQYMMYRNSPFASLVVRALFFWSFFIGPLLSLPLLAVCWVLPYGVKFRTFPVKTQEILVITGCGVLAIAPIIFFSPHYAAPVACSLYIVLMLCMRRVWLWKIHDRAVGRSIVRGTVAACVVVLGFRASADLLHLPQSSLGNIDFQSEQMKQRSRLLVLLQHETGRQLIVVRYAPDHIPHEEWVFNEADINSAKIVWAREMDPADNQRLIDYFKDRQAWLLEPDKNPLGLTKY